MLYGLNNEQEKILPQSRLKANCPVCNAELIPKCGSIKIWHWAHKSNKDCDSWSEGETEWHLGWKKVFPKQWCEQVIKDEDGKIHRADVLLPNGIVIEFQHSSISLDEMQERERFYRKMVWVFDAKKFNLKPNRPFGYKWSWAHKTKLSLTNPIYLDVGDELLLIKDTYGYKYSYINTSFIMNKSTLDALSADALINSINSEEAEIIRKKEEAELIQKERLLKVAEAERLKRKEEAELIEKERIWKEPKTSEAQLDYEWKLVQADDTEMMKKFKAKYEQQEQQESLPPKVKALLDRIQIRFGEHPLYNRQRYR